MNHMNELKKRERQLRTRVRSTSASEFAVTPDERAWLLNHLTGMQTIRDLYLAGVPDEEREYALYRLDFLLPLFTYLSRAFDLHHRAASPT